MLKSKFFITIVTYLIIHKEEVSLMKINKRIIITSGIVLFVLIAVIYLGVAVFYQYHFLPGTTINGKDYSNKSIDSVEESIQNDIRTYYLKILERNGGVEHIAAADIDLQVSIDGDLSTIKDGQNHYLWFLAPKEDARLDVTVTYDETKLDYAIANLDCLNDEYINAGVAPELTYDGVEFTMTEAIPGNEIDKEMTKQYIKESITNMDAVLNLETKNCYLKPLDTESDKTMQDTLNKLNSYLDVVINITFGEKTEVIDRSKINKWLSVDMNNNIILDKDAIIEYVDSFAEEYETMGQTREFTTSFGETIRVNGGDYGWWINRTAEAEAIISDIENLNSCTREANYLQVAGAYGESDIGTTYIEVDLYAQHLYAYKEGELIVDCPMVSGDPVNGKRTPTGLYNMRFMFTNYDFVRGSFKKKLKYWMVFYGDSVETNIGIASCDWLTSFGGSAYKSAGSLGSIYVDEENAKNLYMQLPGKDFPVIIYDYKH